MSVLQVVTMVVGIVYTVGFWAWKGQTPGKMALGIRVVDKDGNPVGIGRSILRYIGYMVSSFIILIGFIMVAFDKKKQGLHDKIANTYVITT